MFLKNSSDKFQCGLRTKKEVLTIKPGEAVHVFDVDIISLNPVLVQITESEYDRLKKQDNKEVKDEKPKEEKQQENEPVEKVESQDNKKKDEEVVLDDAKKEEAPVVVDEQPNSNIPEKSELEQLEEVLQSLKDKWEATDKPGKKAQIQKKIKEVQAQINSLK